MIFSIVVIQGSRDPSLSVAEVDVSGGVVVCLSGLAGAMAVEVVAKVAVAMG
jgi:hypothetical protein